MTVLNFEDNDSDQYINRLLNLNYGYWSFKAMVIYLNIAWDLYDVLKPRQLKPLFPAWFKPSIITKVIIINSIHFKDYFWTYSNTAPPILTDLERQARSCRMTRCCRTLCLSKIRMTQIWIRWIYWWCWDILLKNYITIFL